MFVNDFTLNTLEANVLSHDVRNDEFGNTVERIVYDNGFIWIYTANKNGGFSKMDFSHELFQNGNIYTPDLTSIKKDFYDYY